MHTGVLDESVIGLMRLLVPMGVVVTLLTPLIGYLLAVQATRPVGDILRTAGGLRPTRLDDRLPERGTGDELDLLSHTINHLLDQVADHVQRQERFVADAAHELRGPLAAIQSSLEVAVAGAGNTADIHEVLTDTLEASRQLSRVTNDLLLLAEHAGDQRIVRKETVDLALIVRQTVAMFSGVAGEQGIDLSADASAPAPVTGDAAGLRRIAANLLDNALRFTPDGGRVTARVRCDDGHVTLAVEDTGVGLEAHELSRVFERFYKSDPAHSHGDGHRSGGLGLSICKSLVEMLDGSIRIASARGRGTTVTVVLPATMHATQVSVDAREPSAAHSVALACTPAPVR
jgi:signal transduction histidine kinase